MTEDESLNPSLSLSSLVTGTYEESWIVLTSFTVKRTGVDNICTSILSTLGNVGTSVRRKAGMTVVVPPLARIQTYKNPLVPLQF